MDALNKWYSDFAGTPVGAILMFLAVFFMRILLDTLGRKKARRASRRKPKPTS